MKPLTRGRILKTQEEEKEEALTTFELQREIEKALLNLVVLKNQLEVGGSPNDFDEFQIWISDIKTLIDIFDNELIIENDEENHIVEVFKRYQRINEDDAEVFVILGNPPSFARIMTLKRFKKSLVRNHREERLKIGGSEIDINMYALVPKRHYFMIVCDIILRTAKKLGFLNIVKVKKPDVILGEPENIKLPRFQNVGAGVPITELANNVLYCIMEYVRAPNIKQKMSWLRMALAFLRAFVFEGRVRERVENLLIEVEKVQKMINWDVYEVAKGGHFELIFDEEYREVLEKLTTLERIRDEVIDILLGLGIADVELAKIGKPLHKLIE